MAETPFSQRETNLILKSDGTPWGRRADRDFYGSPPNTNPDDTPPEEYFDFANIPNHKAMENFRNIRHLFISARGLEASDDGAYTPPQLVYTTPQYGDPELLETLAWQYDEGFVKTGFSAVIDSLEKTAKDSGFCVAQNGWYLKTTDPYKGKLFVGRIYSRDPDEFVFDPPDRPPGIYKVEPYGILADKPLNSNVYWSYAYDSKLDNPYGNAIDRCLKPWHKTWIKVFGYWRQGIQKAGLGSWLAKYGPDIAGEDSTSKAKRAELFESVGQLAAGTHSLFNKTTEIESVKLQIEAQIFLDFWTAKNQTDSIVYTGSSTALSEGKYGSRAKSESEGAREKQGLEFLDAGRVSDAFTYQFNRIFAGVNFAPDRLALIPTLQLIFPERIQPTTPADQETSNEEIDKDVEKEIVIERKEEESTELSALTELAEGDEEEPVVPLAIPAGNEDFPRKTPTPESYVDATEEAKAYLEQMPVKIYDDVQPSEAASTFTVKRLRNFGDDSEEGKAKQLEILEALKAAIIPTLDAPDEKAAWKAYYAAAVTILAGFGIPMDTAIRDDLNISFRQARQNSYFEGLLTAARNGLTATGIEFSNLHDGHTIRPEHALFNGLKVALDDPILPRLKLAWDFGCVCWAKIYRGQDFTPADEIPDLDLLGQTYRFYAQPGERLPEAS